VQARLPAAAMTDQRDVADPICSLVRHETKLHPAARGVHQEKVIDFIRSEGLNRDL
jgi:hypothetical protein